MMGELVQSQANALPGVVLTGAAGGIGQALAFALARAGYPLMLVGRQQPALLQVVDKIRQQSSGAILSVLVADLNDPAGRESIVAAVKAESRFRILLNNAGTSEFHAFETQPADRIAHILNTNLLAPMLLTQGLLPVLLTRPESQVINIGSVFGDIGYPGFSSYCASKFGLRGFTQALRRELSDTGLRVRWFAPRATQTALNTPAVVAMNTALKTQADTPERVAALFMDFLDSSRNEQVIGWPERLFVFINRLRHAITDGAIGGQLGVIRRYMPR